MHFVVQKYGEPAPVVHTYTYVLLRQDNWDDYGFKTTFFVDLHDSDRVIPLGTIKVLKLHQEGGFTDLPSMFENLGSNYCSLGQDLDYYEGLARLHPVHRHRILHALRDIVFRPEIKRAFEDESGFEVSLERSGSSVRALIDAGPLVRDEVDISINPQNPNKRSKPIAITFVSSVGGGQFSIPLTFNGGDRAPGRVNVVIGYNGSGKTRLLANLAMVSHADPIERNEEPFIRNYGFFLDQSSFRFSSVVAVSYSAFDTFEVPGRNESERRHLAHSGDVFGYVYCGLRSFRNSSGQPNSLKSINEMDDEFFTSLARTESEPRRSLLFDALKPIGLEPSFARLGLHPSEIHGEVFRKLVFPGLSTGHKIVLNIITQLASNLNFTSLVLIDEPESHLHPPLLAALIRSINNILRARDSYAVIATHSPVVLQEVPKKYDRVLRRFETSTIVDTPEVETFGENVGALTRHVFNLDSSATDYHATLRELASEMSIGEIEQVFGGSMSAQARAYLAALKRGMK